MDVILENVYQKVKKMKNTGKNADYIPELAKVNPKLYAISIFTVDGIEYNIGDCYTEVAIESVSKVFSLALALKTVGISAVRNLIGIQQTSSAFNSICAIEESSNHTINSFENGGAMATTSLYYNANATKYDAKIFNNMSEFAGKKLTYSVPTYKSEISHLDHNLAIAYLLKSYNRFYGDVIPTVLAYTKQCSALVNSKDVALMAATIANDGINPKTQKRVVDKKFISYIVNHMANNGMYEYSEQWMSTIGLPAKSGVGGIIMIVVPGVMGISIISPPLDKHGNSVKGIITAQYIANALPKYVKT